MQEAYIYILVLTFNSNKKKKDFQNTTCEQKNHSILTLDVRPRFV